MAPSEFKTPAIDEDAPPLSVPDSGDTGESGKLKMIVQLVKKCLGVKDIASMRLSLPASLLEPIPNLEYWHYLDRPDLFAAINDSEDEFERMLAVIRFTFSKDLRHIRGKVCKPYNSVLGEHFQAHWDIIPVTYPSDPSQLPIQHLFVSNPAPASAMPSPAPSVAPSAAASPRVAPALSAAPSLAPSETASVRSGKSHTASMFSGGANSPTTTGATSVVSNLEAEVSNLNLTAGEDLSAADFVESDEAAGDAPQSRVRVAYLTEQVSHHPPISSFVASCPARGLQLSGIDQINARVSGTTVRIAAGEHNKGIFVNINAGHGKGERYQITHPVAHVNGILRGSFYVTVGDTTVITCSGGKDGKKLRTILEYKEESWLGKAMFYVEGVIFSYTPDEKGIDDWTRVKNVPKSRALAYLDGSWRHLVRWRRTAAKDANAWMPLLDLSTLHVVPKTVRPIERQAFTESRKLWETVTARLEKKEYGEATKYKQAIEQRQRDEAAERKKKAIEFVPKYFDTDYTSGLPQITDAGRAALEEELKEASPYTLEASLKA